MKLGSSQSTSRVETENLLTAYTRTKFVAYSRGRKLIIRVGKLNKGLDRLMVRHRAESCAFVTGWNPGSVRLSDKENHARHERLIRMVQTLACPFLYGTGVAEDGNWPAEKSVLIFAISEKQAKKLGKRFGQLAIVFVTRGRAPRLLICTRR